MQRYRTDNPLVTQQVEDLVARHVLKGMGLTEKMFYIHEESLLGEKSPDDALWVRVLKLYKVLVHDKSYVTTAHEIDVRASKKNHIDILNLVLENDTGAGDDNFAIMTRVGKTKKSLTYTIWCPEFIGRMTPPYTVIARIPHDKLLVVQDTTLYVRQWGPYYQLERITL